MRKPFKIRLGIIVHVVHQLVAVVRGTLDRAEVAARDAVPDPRAAHDRSDVACALTILEPVDGAADAVVIARRQDDIARGLHVQTVAFMSIHLAAADHKPPARRRRRACEVAREIRPDMREPASKPVCVANVVGRSCVVNRRFRELSPERPAFRAGRRRSLRCGGMRTRCGNRADAEQFLAVSHLVHLILSTPPAPNWATGIWGSPRVASSQVLSHEPERSRHRIRSACPRTSAAIGPSPSIRPPAPVPRTTP